jgi:lysozyme
MEKINREILKAELVRDEGLIVGRTYRCTAGKLSAGVGRNLDDVGLRPEEAEFLDIDLEYVKKHGLTRNQALYLLDGDIDDCLKQLDRQLPWWRHMDGVRQRVLINMCFNMGIRTLLTFKNTLRMMKAGEYEDAAMNMTHSAWYRQVGKRSKRLVDLMFKGELKK